MIIMRSVIVFLLLTEICGFPDEVFAAACVQRRHATFGEFEMIGTIETALLRFTIRFHFSSVAFRGSGQQVVQDGIVVAEVFDVASFPPRIDRKSTRLNSSHVSESRM